MMNEVSLTDFGGFPSDYQFRRQLCKEYERLLEVTGSTQILVIESRPGIGATSICSEYYSTIDEPAILLLVHAGSRAGYSLPFLLDQGVRQARALLNEPQAGSSIEDLPADWQNALLKLSRQARSNRQRIHLIVDGLYQIPSEDERYLQDIIRNVLLVGNPGVLHLLTWKEGATLPGAIARVPFRRVTVPPLMETEASELLRDANLSDAQLREILRCTGCVPAKLASVKRIAGLGKYEQIQLNGALESYYDIEWGALVDAVAPSISKSTLELLFAFVVFSKRPLNIAELQRYTGDLIPEIESAVSGNSFLTRDDNSAFLPASNTHRDFLEKKLGCHRINVLQRFVDLLSIATDSSDSLQLLPAYFEELGRDQEVISFLTPSNLDGYLQSTQSLTALRRRNELGYSAATRTKQEFEAYRFALQNTVVRTLENYGGGRARLAALAAIGKLDEALAIAMGEPTKEGRLVLLSEYASALRGNGLQIDQVLSQTIKNLIQDVDLSSDPGRAIRMAEDLVGSLPDLAIEVVERASQGVQSYQDAALTQLALKHQVHPELGSSEAAESYRSRISDSKLQGFLRAAEAIFSTKSADDIKQSTLGLSGKQRSFFLRQWLRVHPTNSRALEIADYALDEVARDTSYLPIPGDLREICLPVAENPKEALAATVLSRVEIQRSALLDASPTVDMLRLDLEIARGNIALGKLTAEDALSDLYLRTEYVIDDGVRLECFCWLRSGLKRFSLTTTQTETFSKLLDEAIQASTERCLATTAEHIHVFRGAVAALCESSPTQALDLVSKLNTEDRRDEAYAIFIDKLLSRRTAQAIDVDLVHQALSKIASSGARSVAVVECIRLLSKNKPSLVGNPMSLVSRLRAVVNPADRAKGLIDAVTVENHYVKTCDLSAAARTFREATGEIDYPWTAADLSFRFVETVAKIDRSFASEFLDDYQRNLAGQPPASQHLARMTIDLAQLSTIAFCSLLKHRLDDAESYAKVRGIVDDCPSLQARTGLFSDVAVRSYTAGRKDVLERICQERIMPAIKNCEAGSPHLYRQVIASAYAALYLWKESVAEALIGVLEPDERDVMRLDVVHYLVTKTPFTEPYEDSSFRSARIDYTDSLSIISIIERIRADSILVTSIQYFVLAAVARGSTSQISQSQRAALSSKLLEKVNKSLPEQRNVKHNGWKIVATAYCYKLANEQSQAKWEELLDSARDVPNTSDRIYVLACVAPCLPTKLSAEKTRAIHDAETQLKQISSRIDSVRRAISISLAATEEFEKDLAKRLLKNALRESLLLKDKDDASQVQKGIVDQAYQIEPAFAEELLALIDDDPARINARQTAEGALEAQRARGAVRDKRYAELNKEISDLGPIFWKLLAGLNCDRLPAHRPAEAAALFDRAAQVDLSSSQKFYWWYLRNAEEKCTHSKSQSKAVLAPLFEVTTLAAALASKVCGRVALRPHGARVHTAGRTSYLVGSGDDEPALEFVRGWIERASPKELWICDPYFSAGNLDFIKELSFATENVSFTVIACTNAMPNSSLQLDYERAWAQIAHVEPPEIRAIHVHYDGERTKSPIHDRWIIADRSNGLRIGGSINGLAAAKLSEISEMRREEVASVAEALDAFVAMRERTLQGMKLRYQVVHGSSLGR